MRYEKSCGTIIFKEDEVLLVKQKTGFYGFPKGHMEIGETEIETAIRETKEETNVDVKIDSKYRFSTSYLIEENVMKEVIYFIAYPINNIEVKAQEKEISGVEWIKIDDVENVLTFNNIKELWRTVLKEVGKNIY